jgi:hypothetical protein
VRLSGVVTVGVVLAATAATPASPPDWVETSNRNAQVLLDAMAEVSPETAAFFGVEGVDEEILVLSAGYRERQRTILRRAGDELRGRLADAVHPKVRQGITPEEARRVLLEDVVLSDAAATSEVDRYTFRAPGQACSYYYGYSRMITHRSDVQKALGADFDLRAFHDFVLAQGLLTPDLLRQAVFDDLVGAAGR